MAEFSFRVQRNESMPLTKAFTMAVWRRLSTQPPATSSG
jgi:hypothetical protein